MDALERVLAVIDRRQAEYVRFLQDLVRQDTQVVGHGILGGSEINGQRMIIAKLEEIGADVDVWVPENERLEQYAGANRGHHYDENRPNVVGVFKGTGGGKSLILNGHVDTMPLGPLDAWTQKPLGGEIVDGKLYGRGSVDMKAGVASNLMAIAALKEAGIKLKGDVIYESVVDEEGGGNGTLAAVDRGYKADGAIVSEPTALSVYPCHMGWIFYSVKVVGKALHSSRKWLGVNAIEKAYHLIQALNELEHQWLMDHQHPLLPGPTLNIGEIRGGTAGSTVPEECEFKLCLHYQPGDLDANGTDANVEKQVLDAIFKRAAGDAWMAENPPIVTRYQEGLPFEVPIDHPLVQTTVSAATDILGRPAVVEGMPAGCDARHFTTLADTPVIVFGPGYPRMAHAIDEYVPVDQYLQHIRILARMMLQWCGTEA